MRLIFWVFSLVVVMVFLWSCDTNQTFNTRSSTDLDSLLLKGIEDTRQLKFEQAQAGLLELLREAKIRGDEKNIVLANLNLGNLYHHFNLQDEALKYFIQCLELAEAGNQHDLLNAIYNNIGVIYAKNNANEEAVHYFSLALEKSRKIGSRSKEGLNLLNLAIAFDGMDNEKLAVEYLNRATDIFNHLRDSINLGAIENTRGNIYFKKQDYHNALHYYRNAMKLMPKNQHAWFNAEYASNMAKTFLQFDNPDSALAYVVKAQQIFEQLDDKEQLSEVNLTMAEAYIKTEDTLLAINLFREALQLKNEMLEEKTSKWVSERQMNYEFGKKEKELELLRLDAKRRQAIWMSTAVGGTLVLVLLLIILRTKIQNLHQKNIILEQDKKVTHLTIEKEAAYREKIEQDLKNKEEVNKIERAKLQQELDFRNRELVTKAMHLVNKNETLSTIDNILEKYEKLPSSLRDKAILDARKLLRFEKNIDEDWKDFKLHFEEIHPEFFSELNKNYPELNSNDLRMCAYLRLDLSTKEIARIYNISPDSVRKRKQRLREKLELSAENDLNEWLRSNFVSS